MFYIECLTLNICQQSKGKILDKSWSCLWTVELQRKIKRILFAIDSICKIFSMVIEKMMITLLYSEIKFNYLISCKVSKYKSNNIQNINLNKFNQKGFLTRFSRGLPKVLDLILLKDRLVSFGLNFSCIVLFNQIKLKFVSLSKKTIEETIGFFNKFRNNLRNAKRDYEYSQITRMEIPIIEDIKLSRIMAINKV